LHLILIVWGLASGALASPRDARYAEDPDHLFWFLVIADLHIGENLWGGTQDTDNLGWVLNEAVPVVQPRMVVACGDLVDATHGGLIPLDQSDDEWSEYRAIVDASGMTPAVYLDLPGNHDQYCDKGLTHFLKYSLQGSMDAQTQHSMRVEMQDGFYHFLAVSTPANDGACWPADNAGLDAAEMDFIRAAFADNADARLTFAFGHHGVHWGESNNVGEGGEEFRGLLRTYEVAAYFWGHTHAYFNEFHDGSLFFNVQSLGKSDERNVALAAVDHDALAVRAFTAREWPFLLVTAPADASLGGGNPYAYVVPHGWAAAPVRALVFSKPDPEQVRFQVDGGPWMPMSGGPTGVFQAAMDAAALAPGEHRLRVRADPWNQADHEIRFVVADTACSNGLDDDGDGWTDYPEDPGCENPADLDEANPPLIPEPDPTPDESAEPFPTPDESAADERDAAIPESSEPGFVEPAFVEEAGSPREVDSYEAAVVADAGPEISFEPGLDHGTAPAEGAQRGEPADRVEADSARVPGRAGGGCAAAGADDPVGLWWLLFLVPFFRRRSET